MRYRRLGHHGPHVSAIGLGRGSQPVQPGDPLRPAFEATVQRALDLGINFFDTSDAYWGGWHESLLGRALKGRRSEALIGTKFGNIDLPGGGKATNGRPEYVFRCCDASLERLGIDVIDIYYLHRVDPAVPIEETVGAMAQLISQGKVRFLGLCEASVRTLRRACREHPVAVLQTEYSLWYREVEREIVPACRELGVGYVAYAPLGRGLLTGRIRTPQDLPEHDRRRRHPRFSGDNLQRNVAMVEELETVAAECAASASQVAIAWLLAQGEDIVPIPGTNHVRNLEENAAATELQLSDAQRERLATVFAIGAGAGERYMPNTLKGVGL
jgi:aryl-alcohol dehydrogenase-like predicted oxidoreductase